MHALGSSDVEEGGDLAHYVPQQPRLEAAEAARVAVHRIDRPDGVTALAPGGAHQLGQVIADIRGAETPRSEAHTSELQHLMRSPSAGSCLKRQSHTKD